MVSAAAVHRGVHADRLWAVEQTLKRVGKFAEVPMRPIVASPKRYEYRNRIRVHVEAGVTGFYAHGSRSLIDIAQCRDPDVRHLQQARDQLMPATAHATDRFGASHSDDRDAHRFVGANRPRCRGAERAARSGHSEARHHRGFQEPPA